MSDRRPSPSKPFMDMALSCALVALAGCSTSQRPHEPAPEPPPTIAAAPAPAAASGSPLPDEPLATQQARLATRTAAEAFSRHDTAVALASLEDALKADPHFEPAVALRATIRSSLGKHHLAETDFKTALQWDPGDVDAIQDYGWALCQRRRYADADTLFRRALALDRPDSNGRIWLAQGICLARAGRWVPAQAALEHAYQAEPDSPIATMNLAELLMRRGDYERARFLVRRVNACVDCVNAQTLWLAARIEFRAGNLSGARQFGEALAQRYSHSPEAAAFRNERYSDGAR